MFSNAIREDEMTRAAAPIRKNCQPLAVLLEKAADTILENGSVFVHYAQKLNELADRYSEGRFHPAVLGQFKRGKSTLLNALTGVPGSEPLALTQLLLDFNGTLSVDGVLLPGVSDTPGGAWAEVAHHCFNSRHLRGAAKQLEGLPVQLHLIKTGHDKVVFLSGLKCSETATVGNGRNDVGMVHGAVVLGIAAKVCFKNGCSSRWLNAYSVTPTAR